MQKVNEFQAEGLSCYVMNNGMFLTGYVGIKPDHPLYGVAYWSEISFNDGTTISVDCLFQVHGGLTYSDFHEHKDEWVFGFDCAHRGDSFADGTSIVPGGVYRDVEYVSEMCRLLAVQLAAFQKMPQPLLEKNND